VPKDWKHYEVNRKFRGADYHITVLNPSGVNHGVKSLTVNGTAVEGNVVPMQAEGTTNEVVVTLG
jgi:cellobiose phosphorylase